MNVRENGYTVNVVLLHVVTTSVNSREKSLKKKKFVLLAKDGFSLERARKKKNF